jgi:hypothetical protein
MTRGITLIAATVLLVARGAAAAEESCVVVGGPGAPVEVRIYESNPYGSPGGKRLFVGPLNRGERHRIANKHGRIWYAMRWHDGDTWKEGFEASCRGGEEVEFPAAEKSR